MVIFSHSCDIFQTLEDGNSMICILHSNHFPLLKIEKRKKWCFPLEIWRGVSQNPTVDLGVSRNWNRIGLQCNVEHSDEVDYSTTCNLFFHL